MHMMVGVPFFFSKKFLAFDSPQKEASAQIAPNCIQNQNFFPIDFARGGEASSDISYIDIQNQSFYGFVHKQTTFLEFGSLPRREHPSCD